MYLLDTQVLIRLSLFSSQYLLRLHRTGRFLYAEADNTRPFFSTANVGIIQIQFFPERSYCSAPGKFADRAYDLDLGIESRGEQRRADHGLSSARFPYCSLMHTQYPWQLCSPPTAQPAQVSHPLPCHVCKAPVIPTCSAVPRGQEPNFQLSANPKTL